jgi:hypothetical protein
MEKISFCGEIGVKNCTALNSFLKLSLVFIFIHGQDFGTNSLLPFFMHKYLKVFDKDNTNLVFKTKI